MSNQMKEIDWSKAPEGATHYDTDFDLFCNENGYWRPSGIWVSDNKQNEWGTHRYVARPVAWTGEGLPPVGAACEVAPHNSQWGFDTIEPRRCTILAYHADFVWLDTGVPGTPISTRTDKVDFNVIRTPEQIAEEEREKAIDTILDDLSLSPECRYIAKRVYESGYRKVTP